MTSDIRRQLKALGIDPDREGITVGPSVADTLQKRPIIKATRTQVGRTKTATETRYEDFLTLSAAADLVSLWIPQPFAIRLTPDMTYTPDYLVVLADGRPCLVEIKGAKIWRHNVEKFKMARAMRPEYLWLCLQWEKGSWHVRYKTGKEPILLVPA